LNLFFYFRMKQNEDMIANKKKPHFFLFEN